MLCARVQRRRLQQAHRERVASGKFDATPLAGKVGRTVNEHVDSVQSLLKAVAATVGTMHKLGDSGKAVSAELDVMRSLHMLLPRPSGFVGRRRVEYVKAFQDVINWEFVGARFKKFLTAE